MTYTNIVLDKEHLLAFLVGRSGVIVEHYVSSQPINIIIPYSEYLSFIKNIVKDDLDILRNPISVYKSALSAGEYSNNMIKMYHYDIFLIGIDELNKSSARSLECTRIFCNIDVENIYKYKKIKVGIDDIVNLMINNFSKEERDLINLKISKLNPVNPNIFNDSNLSINLNMYFYLCCILGVYLCNKNFTVILEEVVNLVDIR